jgi:hypothetical protein
MAAITESDLVWRYSLRTATSGWQTTSTGTTSLGKCMSTSVCPSGILHALYDVVTGDEASTGMTDYRCIFIHNTHGTNTLQSPKVWITASGGTASATVTIGSSLIQPTLSNYNGSQAEVITLETDAPAGINFVDVHTKDTGLAITNTGIGPGQCVGIWLKRVVPPGAAAVSNAYVTIRIEGDTAA